MTQGLVFSMKLDLALYSFKYYKCIRRHCLFRNVPGLKWRLLSNVSARGGKSSETVANWNN